MAESSATDATTPAASSFDAIVVGAGPAGSAAALALARAGRSVVMVERGPFPGSKNVYGGVVYGRVLDAIVPGWWEEVPVERWVVRRSTMVMTESQSLSVDFRSEAWGNAPFNGMTTVRSAFDSWLATKATDAGATLLNATVATGLVRDGRGRVTGVRTDRDGAELQAPVVIACDGVNSFLAKEAGLAPSSDASHHTLGVKEILALPAEVINERFPGAGSSTPTPTRSASGWWCPSPTWPSPGSVPRSWSPTSRTIRPSLPTCAGLRCASTPPI